MRSENLPGLAKALFDEAGDALFLFDPETDELLDVNPLAEKLSGFPRADLLRLAATYLFRFGGKGGKKRLRDAAAKTGVFHSQEGYFLRTHEDGVWLPVNLTVTRLHVQPKTLALITARDVRERHDANERVQKMETELRRVLSSVADCLWSAEIDARGRWSYRLVSPVIEKITGRPAPFFDRPSRWWRVIYPEDLPRYRAAFAALAPGQELQLEYRLLRLDGAVRWVRDSVRVSQRAAVDGEVPPLRLDGVLTDITEHKRAEDALQKEQALMRALMDNVPDSIYFKDAASRFTHISRGLAARLGVQDPREAAGKSDSDFFSAEHARQALEDEQEVMRTGEPLIGKEEKETWADGRVRWVLTNKLPLRDQAGTIIGTFGLSRDITKRKQAEEDRGLLLAREQEMRRDLEEAVALLRRSEARFRSLFESSIIGVMVADLTGTIVEANDAFLAMVGYSRADLPLRWDTQLTPPEYRAQSRRAVELLRRSGIASPWEKEYIRKDGSRIPIMIGVAMLPGTVEQCVCFVLDVSERNRMRTALVQTEKLASIGLLSAGIAHEINNPLAYVANNLAVIETDLKGLLALLEIYEGARAEWAQVAPAAAQRAAELSETMDLGYARTNLERILGRTREGVQRITRIVQSLRSLARTDPASMEDVQIGQVLDMSLDMIRGELKRHNITVEVTRPSAPSFRGISTRISQVILNILVNAMQAIAAANRGPAGRIHITTRTVGTELLIEISDNGNGISAEDLPRIFDPFFTRKPVGEGTGLGLSISHGIVTGHGGRLEVESQPGVGSVFRIYLPLQPAARAD
jgi:PAS domain S-box-containing protein